MQEYVEWTYKNTKYRPIIGHHEVGKIYLKY